jgi:hypothetical protein
MTRSLAECYDDPIRIHADTALEQAMTLIEPDELRCFSDLLARRSRSMADFDLRELDLTDPKSDELLPIKGYVEVRRKFNNVHIDYPTGDGTSWVRAFEKDLGSGRFG